ncbi:receptor-like protein kinase, partial [Trifolium pratense]
FDLPEFSHLGWGHWFTLRDLELATNKFSKANIIGEGGYGVVYQGQLINGNPVAIKMLLNNLLAYLHEGSQVDIGGCHYRGI